MSEPSTTEQRPTPRRRLRIAVLVICLFAGPLLAEGVMRFLLFHPSHFALRWGAGLRSPGRFADPLLDDEYWLLKWELNKASRIERPPPYDERLGWVTHLIEPGTYQHRDRDKLGGRRPILLYGASYAQNFGSRLVERSELATEYSLLNYGVGGAGAGQAYLLMRESLDLYRGQDPVVVIGLVADSDFDRAVLHFRALPKARLRLVEGELVSEEPVLPGGGQAYLDAYGDGVRSYAWRYLLHSKGLLPPAWQARLSGRRAKQEEKLELVTAIVLAIQADLEQRGLDYFFLLFSSQRGLPPRGVSGQQIALVGIFEEHGIPYVPVSEYFAEAAGDDREAMNALFHQTGRMKNHPTGLGNQVVLQALIDGIAKYAERPVPTPVSSGGE